MNKESAVSELVGVILLIAVISTGMTIVGMQMTSVKQPEKIPDFGISVVKDSPAALSVYHTGGENIFPTEASFYLDGVLKDNVKEIKILTSKGIIKEWTDENPWGTGTKLIIPIDNSSKMLTFSYKGGSFQKLILTADVAPPQAQPNQKLKVKRGRESVSLTNQGPGPLVPDKVIITIDNNPVNPDTITVTNEAGVPEPWTDFLNVDDTMTIPVPENSTILTFTNEGSDIQVINIPYEPIPTVATTVPTPTPCPTLSIPTPFPYNVEICVKKDYTVQFFDTTLGNPVSWHWELWHDKSTKRDYESFDQNPRFANLGKDGGWKLDLTVQNSCGSTAHVEKVHYNLQACKK